MIIILASSLGRAWQQARGSGRQHKAQGEAKRNPGNLTPKNCQAHEVGDSLRESSGLFFSNNASSFSRSVAPLRGLLIPIFLILGFRFRSTPGPGSPAEHLGWGGSLYAVASSAGCKIGKLARSVRARTASSPESTLTSDCSFARTT